jgi:hypothetical protein
VSSLPSETISMAVIAASKPLLPAFVPARSTACSMVSVVSTPTADHGTDRDDGVERARLREAENDVRNFPRSRHAHDGQSILGHAVADEGVPGATDELFDDEVVEAGGHDGEANAARHDERAFDARGIRLRFSGSHGWRGTYH